MQKYQEDLDSNKTQPHYAHYFGLGTRGPAKDEYLVLDCYNEAVKGNCKASLINSSTNLKTIGGDNITPNCKIIRSRGKIYVRALKDIKAGEELFCVYGNTFDYASARSRTTTSASSINGHLVPSPPPPSTTTTTTTTFSSSSLGNST